MANIMKEKLPAFGREAAGKQWWEVLVGLKPYILPTAQLSKSFQIKSHKMTSKVGSCATAVWFQQSLSYKHLTNHMPWLPPPSRISLLLLPMPFLLTGKCRHLSELESCLLSLGRHPFSQLPMTLDCVHLHGELEHPF